MSWGSFATSDGFFSSCCKAGRSRIIRGQSVVNSIPGFPSGRSFRNSLTTIQPCMRWLLARTSPIPFSVKISAIVRPLSFCVLHMSGGATVN